MKKYRYLVLFFSILIGCVPTTNLPEIQGLISVTPTPTATPSGGTSATESGLPSSEPTTTPTPESGSSQTDSNPSGTTNVVSTATPTVTPTPTSTPTTSGGGGGGGGGGYVPPTSPTPTVTPTATPTPPSTVLVTASIAPDVMSVAESPVP